MKTTLLACVLALGTVAPALAQEDITTLPADARDIPVAVGICGAGLTVAGAALGLSLSNPATAVSAVVALIMCSIVVETELPG